LARVEISINGRGYTVACDDGQEDRVRELGAFVDDKLKTLGGGGASEAQLLVLTSLVLADELIELRQTLAQPAPAPGSELDAHEAEVLIAAVDHLTDRIDSIAAKLGRS
jgi:cell division protein ZapA